MSQENVEIVKAAYKSWNAGNMDAFRDLYDPGAIIVRGLEGWPEGGRPTVGREAVMRELEQLREAWDTDALEPISFIDAGDRVVVRYIWRGTGHGPDLTQEQTVICTLRKSKIFLLEYFRNHAEALEGTPTSGAAGVALEADEFIEAGEHVVMPNTLHAKGRDGIEVQARAAWVWTIRDASITRVCFYQERQDALDAVGLSEQDAQADS